MSTTEKMVYSTRIFLPEWRDKADQERNAIQFDSQQRLGYVVSRWEWEDLGESIGELRAYGYPVDS